VSDSQAPDPPASEQKPDEPAPDDVALHDLVPTAPATPVTPAPALTTDPTVVPVAPVETGYTSAGVPTFDYAREKIESRYGTSIGAAELAAETPEGRSVEEQYEARQKAAAERLAQIRESMRGDTPDPENEQA